MPDRLLSAAEIIADSWPDTFRYNPDRDINRIRAMLRNANLSPDQREDLKRKLNQYLRDAFELYQVQQKAGQ
jgi:hypothetical protein